MRWISLISSGHSIQMQKNTPSSQVYMEHSPGQTISWVKNQTSVNLRKLKLYHASSLTTMRLDINYKKKTVKNTNTWRLNNTFINNQQVTEEIKKEIKKFLETNDNENMTTHNLWDTAKAVLRGKFIAIQSYLKKQEKHRIDNLTSHLPGKRTTTTTKKQKTNKQKKTKLVEGKKS